MFFSIISWKKALLQSLVLNTVNWLIRYALLQSYTLITMMYETLYFSGVSSARLYGRAKLRYSVRDKVMASWRGHDLQSPLASCQEDWNKYESKGFQSITVRLVHCLKIMRSQKGKKQHLGFQVVVNNQLNNVA